MHFPHKDDCFAVALILDYGSLLSGVTDPKNPVRLLHSSFHDFLTDQLQTGDYFVGESGIQADLAFASLCPSWWSMLQYLWTGEFLPAQFRCTWPSCKSQNQDSISFGILMSLLGKASAGNPVLVKSLKTRYACVYLSQETMF